MKKVLAIVLAVTVTVALMATPALAQGNGPKYPKWEAPLGDECGKVIYNTHPEDDETYELEVEVEECMALAESTVYVYLDEDPTSIGTIDIDVNGNGKATFYVEYIDNDSVVEVLDTITLTSGAFTLWSK